MAKHVVATVGEIPPGSRKVVEVLGRSIGIFNVNGEFFALGIGARIRAAALRGSALGLLEASAPASSPQPRGEILTCGWHVGEFDLHTGQSWCDPRRLRVRRADVAPAGAASAAGSSSARPHHLDNARVGA
jgi:3-phenylpropionate/trans-cinnamate dioxygenase ferredoxin subunit